MIQSHTLSMVQTCIGAEPVQVATLRGVRGGIERHLPMRPPPLPGHCLQQIITSTSLSEPLLICIQASSPSCSHYQCHHYFRAIWRGRSVIAFYCDMPAVKVVASSSRVVKRLNGDFVKRRLMGGKLQQI